MVRDQSGGGDRTIRRGTAQAVEAVRWREATIGPGDQIAAVAGECIAVGVCPRGGPDRRPKDVCGTLAWGRNPHFRTASRPRCPVFDVRVVSSARESLDGDGFELARAVVGREHRVAVGLEGKLTRKAATPDLANKGR